mmetsp:Transcript_76680/g.194582  ORF Transcript_76680/g.194582 Transcript_76680/m.194582 type:complete len:96 (-) Transcript_76680:66-353(-)
MLTKSPTKKTMQSQVTADQGSARIDLPREGFEQASTGPAAMEDWLLKRCAAFESQKETRLAVAALLCTQGQGLDVPQTSLGVYLLMFVCAPFPVY